MYCGSVVHSTKRLPVVLDPDNDTFPRSLVLERSKTVASENGQALLAVELGEENISFVEKEDAAPFVGNSRNSVKQDDTSLAFSWLRPSQQSLYWGRVLWYDESAKAISAKTERVKAIFKRPKSNALIAFDASTTQVSALSDVASDNIDPDKTVDDALVELKNQMNRFQKEVDMCAQERLGRVEQTAKQVKLGTLIVANEMRLTHRNKRGGCQNGKRQYHPYFNGGLDHEELDQLDLERQRSTKEARMEQNKATAKLWLGNLQEVVTGFEANPREDVQNCLTHMESLGPDGKDMAFSLFDSEDLAAWNEAEFSVHGPDIVTGSGSFSMSAGDIYRDLMSEEWN
ncbi:hypothetical protein B0T16DRAFT_392559 [Cercophora newfieldiana]|uniref:Uncharacterized protein n=1 Tax=Cercophora newfieldiana TaxID=92897 RepID=A0AA39Y199_9PEZI|nr:hypothetical protein B0T16DRAFT_392559 [Cercophora newfieldiana]